MISCTSFSKTLLILTGWCLMRHASGFVVSTPSRRISLYSSPSLPALTETLDSSKKTEPSRPQPLRATLRGVTGFSWTTFRATLRAATGISLTAVYAATLAASGQWIRQTMRWCLSLLPAWARYFVQPLLVCYYTPFFILRNMSSPRRRKRDIVVDGWQEAMERADDRSDTFWPTDEK